MNAVEYINNNLNPMEILEYYEFNNITDQGNCIRACCKIHGGNNPSAFCWNKENNLWCCFTGECGGGDVFTLVEKIEGIPFIQAVSKVASILGLNIIGMSVNEPMDRIKTNHKKWLKKQLNNMDTNEPYTISFTKYTHTCDGFDRFDEEIVKYYKAGFAKLYPTETGVLKNKLVIPLYDKDMCVGVALRDTTGIYKPKWLYMPEGLKVSKFLYNLENALNTIDKYNLDSIILVEGIFDVWAYHRAGIDNVVAIFGSSLKDDQFKTLIGLGVDFVFSFDNDEAGIKCTNKCIEMLKQYGRIQVVNLPENSDPADMQTEQLLKAYCERQRI